MPQNVTIFHIFFIFNIKLLFIIIIFRILLYTIFKFYFRLVKDYRSFLVVELWPVLLPIKDRERISTIIKSSNRG